MEKQTLIVRVQRVRNTKHTHQYIRAKVLGSDGSCKCQVKSPVSFGNDPSWDNALLELQEVSLDDLVEFHLRNMDPLQIMPVTLASTVISVRDLIRRPHITLFLEDMPKSKMTYKNAGKQVLQNIGTTMKAPFVKSGGSTVSADSMLEGIEGDDLYRPSADGSTSTPPLPVLLDVSIDNGSFPLSWPRPLPSRFGVDKDGKVQVTRSSSRDSGNIFDVRPMNLVEPADESKLKKPGVCRSHSAPDLQGSLDEDFLEGDLGRSSAGSSAGVGVLPGLHLMLMTRGTRGDVQPFVALARGLCEREGAIVTIVSELRWKKFIKDNSRGLGRGAIRYRPSGGDTMSRIDTRIAKWAMQYDGKGNALMQSIMLSRSEREFFESMPAMFHWAYR
jgi:hypothetical protein